MSLAESVQRRLPTDGTMGALRRSSDGLYWLAIVMGITGFVAGVLASVAGVLLLVATAIRAFLASVSSTPWQTAQWLAVMLVSAAFVVAVIYLAMRWVGAFTTGGSD